MKSFYILIALLLAFQVRAQVRVNEMFCEQRKEPVGIDMPEPRFSWNLGSQLRDVQQLSYEIMVATNRQDLEMNQPDVWTSGVVTSQNTILVPYNGPALRSGTRYYWKVNVVTNKDVCAMISSFHTGLMQANEWKAKWIGLDEASPWDSISQWSRLSARYLRKSFECNKKVKRAVAYVSGLGLYHFALNQSFNGNHAMAPNPTDYRKTVLYNTYDLTALVRQGTNTIAVLLGNGRFFTMRQNYKTHKHNTFGFPKLLFQLEIEYADGSKETVVSDETWKLNVDGPIRTNNEYDGEEYNATKEFDGTRYGWTKETFDDASWMQARIVEAPAGVLKAQTSEPVTIVSQVFPKSVTQVGVGRYIVDMGQNFSGYINVAIPPRATNRGKQVKFRFGESLQPNGELFTANLRDAKVTDVYTMRGRGVEEGRIYRSMRERWSPDFVYHGFRYVEVTGFPGIPTIANFQGMVIADKMENTGTFSTSSDLLNSIYQNAYWGILSNYKGMPVDCPQRNERQPWLGDRTVGAQGEMYVFNNANLYAKWMQDIADAQTPEGSIPDVAPAFWNYYSDNVTWPAAFITVTNSLYNQFGDSKPIQEHYDAMKKWILYMREKYLANYIMTRDKYGDWCVPPESLTLIHAKDSTRITDGKLIATAYYYKLLFYMQRFANITARSADAKYYGQLADSIRIAFHQRFFDPVKSYYGNNTVTANLLPLYFGLCPDSLRDKVFEHIYNKIHFTDKDHISTGLIGTQYLMRGLTEYGQVDLAFKIASNETYPGWGYMVKNGATTIWELWNGNTADPGMNSQNHVMLLGDLLTWFYENLGGIRSDKTNVGFRKIIMKPVLPAGLNFVSASYKSSNGKIESDWSRTAKGDFKWDIVIPPNTIASVYVPCSNETSLRESGKALSLAEGVTFVKFEKGMAELKVASGAYSFSAKVN